MASERADAGAAEVPDVSRRPRDGPDVELALEESSAGLLASAAIDGHAETSVAVCVEAAERGVPPQDALAFARLVGAAAAVWLGGGPHAD